MSTKDSVMDKATLYLYYRSRERKLAELADLAHLSLEKMGLTLVEILNEINMAQVFLWLQEKSLFGQGALLHNPTPGVDFSGADLIRNLILVSVMDQSLSYQAQFYRVVHQHQGVCCF